MTPDFWWGALVGFLAFVALLVSATVICAFVLMRGAEMAEPRVWTGHDDETERFLRGLNRRTDT